MPDPTGMEKLHSDEMVTLGEARRRTGIGRRQFKRAVDEGGLAAFMIGAWPRVRWRDVLAWVERQRRAPERQPDRRERS
jgi:excisionase family DNA binding protein